jgi:serine/threonine-protein phosphatase 6 regulatory ankyrin repeat subunit B
MGFLEHLQSSIILGTHLDIPQSAHFDIERINLFFHYIESNDHDNVKTMIHQGFCIDTPHHKTHITPLLYAIDLKLESLALLLVYNGANIYATNTKNESALFLSLKQKLFALSELIIKNGAFSLQDFSMKKMSFDLLTTTKSDLLDTYESLMFQTPKQENIFNIAHQGDIHNFVFFTAQRPRLTIKNSKKQSLLHLAVMSGSVELSNLLLNRGINIDERDKYGNSPLIYATYSPKRLEILELLIQRGATLDQMNHAEHTALSMSIRKQNTKAIDLLIHAGANINQRDGIHTTLSLVHDQLHTNSLSEEKSNYFRNLLTYLHIHGAHVNSCGDTIGWTPLQLTMNYNDSSYYIKHAQKLISLGANIDVQDNVGRSPLMIAAALGRVEGIKVLADHGANLNLVDKYGWSALMLAVYNNKFEVVQELLIYQADVNLTSKGQLNALKIAIDQKNRKIELYLRDNGAFLQEQ